MNSNKRRVKAESIPCALGKKLITPISKQEHLRGLESSLARKRMLQEQKTQQWLEANRPKLAASELHCLTWDYLNDPTTRLTFKPAKNQTWQDYAADAWRHSTTATLKQLLETPNQQSAITAVVDVADNATRRLTGIAESAPAKLRPIAHKRLVWPFLIASQKRFSDPADAIAKAIQLGRRLPFSTDSIKRSRKDNHTYRLTVDLLCRLKSARSSKFVFVRRLSHKHAVKLKAFSSHSWKAWADAAWKLLLDEHAGHPERNRKLRALGEYRAQHSRLLEQQAKATPATIESNIRDGIKDTIRKQIERLAKSE